MDSPKSKFLQAVEEDFTVPRRITGRWHLETVDLIIKQWKLHKIKIRRQCRKTYLASTTNSKYKCHKVSSKKKTNWNVGVGYKTKFLPSLWAFKVSELLNLLCQHRKLLTNSRKATIWNSNRFWRIYNK